MPDYRSTTPCLAIIVGATGLLWLWLVLPQELLTESGYGTVLLLLVGGLNIWVFRGATRPLWRGVRPTASQDVGRGLVLVPCLLFHLITPPGSLLLLVALALT